MDPSKEKPRLLIVEDKMSVYLPLRKALLERFPPDTEVSTAETSAEGVSMAMGRRFHALLVSNELPDDFGSEMIEAVRSRYHGMPDSHIEYFLFYDPSRGDLDGVQFLRRFPEVSLIEKPFLPMEVATLVLDAVCPIYAKEMGYYNLGLYDLIQAYMLPRRSVTLRVLSEDGQMGLIGVRRGRLVHAALGDTTGLEALGKIAAMNHGKIRLERGCVTAMETINLRPQEALIEAARIINEHTSRVDMVSGESIPGAPSPRAEEGSTGPKIIFALDKDRFTRSKHNADGSVSPQEDTEEVPDDLAKATQKVRYDSTQVERLENTVIEDPEATRIESMEKTQIRLPDETIVVDRKTYLNEEDEESSEDDELINRARPPRY